MTLIAYHGKDAEKSAILATLAQHRAADELVQGYGYWADGKGCAVGCTIKSYDHMQYETLFGIPVHLAKLEDLIFEGLPVELARQWPERFMGAIRVGSDLSRVHWKLLHWLLTEETINHGIKHEMVASAVRACTDLIEGLADGGVLERGRAERKAWSSAIAAMSALSVARTAERAAADAAWSPGRSSNSAVIAARYAAVRDAKAAWTKIADRLIKEIERAPMATS